ncbi:xanthine dehydrogenase accessory protein XdhC [Thalassovita sp.]|uniref:xanthine dehydrogenase accessory protein XdhC n=1 Tax=Thalassovita sp. TaxID=1979401 RepID=UPI0028827D3B|nr:xanthine dehydrogenase accessory protein XdhC [Thalassovita sp.]MDF1804511.1 xanthine dehydrogenase accessory protein XdhC [Thalassovita sp.]
MGFDLDALRAAVAAHGRVTRVVIARIEGSSPREVGAAMLLWDGGQSGTIGGGALELMATQEAQNARTDRLSTHVLGPDLGQCCGGRITLLHEVYDAGRLAALMAHDVIARAVDGSPMPLSVKRVLSRARAQGVRPQSQLHQGWMIEPVHRPETPLWIWGAGHVGRALVDVLAPLPDLAITWVDTAPQRFPDKIPAGVTSVPAARPEMLVPHAPPRARHLILTYSHVLDLELCHALLSHGFASCGLIGSATKWARFRTRLTALGHSIASISSINCPIGQPELGKHPQAIAIGVAGEILNATERKIPQYKDKTG